MTAATAPKKAAKDWSPADIKYALDQKRLSLRALSIQHGYSPNTLSNALRVPYLKAEGIIAEAIGERPETIWPTRYAWRNSKPSVAQFAAN